MTRTFVRNTWLTEVSRNTFDAWRCMSYIHSRSWWAVIFVVSHVVLDSTSFNNKYLPKAVVIIQALVRSSTSLSSGTRDFQHAAGVHRGQRCWDFSEIRMLCTRGDRWPKARKIDLCCVITWELNLCTGINQDGNEASHFEAIAHGHPCWRQMNGWLH